MLEYPFFAQGNVVAFSTMRDDGDTDTATLRPDEPYAGFNATHYCGDSAEHVAQCRQWLTEKLNIANERLLLPRQTHSDHVGLISSSFFSLSLDQQTALLDDTDALITAERGVCIGISTADCVPILLFDAAHGAIAAVHAGWRGTVARIVEKTIAELSAAFGTKPSELKAVIGPCIMQESFEVGEEVVAAFAAAGFDTRAICRLLPSPTLPKLTPHIDLVAANTASLLSAGLSLQNICACGICTYTHYARFFSARRLGICSGRIYSGIMVK